MEREFRVGVRVDDLCRACKMVRDHTVMAVGEGVVRVFCDFCGSQHNYRGGAAAATRGSSSSGPGRPAAEGPFPPVSDREMSEIEMDAGKAEFTNVELERLMRRVFREESGLTPVKLPHPQRTPKRHHEESARNTPQWGRGRDGHFEVRKHER